MTLSRSADGSPRSRWRGFRSAHANSTDGAGHARVAEAGKTRLSTHYLRYSTGSALVMLAGFVSFPILTRLLDNTQYGILGYYDTWVLIAVAIGKLGAQHTVLRFYPHGEDGERWHAFVTNLFYLPLAMSMCLWAAVAAGLLGYDLLSGARQSPMLWLALLMAPMAIVGSMGEMVMRAGERSRMVMYNRVGWRWLELSMTLGAVLLLQHTALAAYGGRVAAAFVAVAFYVRWIARHLPFVRDSVDLGQLRDGMAYGLPMIANELIMVALVAADRLLIKHLMGDFAPLGVYTIGASLAMQVNVFLGITMFEAFAPMANRLYDTEGAAAVCALKARMLLPMTYAAAGIALLLGLFGTDAIIALSGASKAGSGPVFAAMGVVYALQPVLMVAGYGLLLQKRSGKVMALMLVTLGVNVALNLLLIPRLGVMGSVYATAMTAALLAFAHCVLVPRDLLQLPALRTVLSAGTAAALCAAAVWATDLYGARAGWMRLTLGGASVATLYLLLVLTFDSNLRALARAATTRLLVRFTPATA